MRLAVITSKFPCSRSAEAFFTEEAEHLAHRCGLVIAPVNGSGRIFYTVKHATVAAQPLFSAAVLADAARTWSRSWRECLKILVLICSAGQWSVRLKNLMAFPKALALAQRFKRLGVDHVHAYWLSTPATIAMIVGRLNGIPWSATAHRWDIYEDNFRTEKAREAGFIRTISLRGTRDLQAVLPQSLSAKVHCVRLGAELPKTTARISSRGTFRILCPASLVAVKGHETLLRALAMLRENGLEFLCVCAGEGPLLSTLQDRALSLGLSGAVDFAGFIAHERLLADLRSGSYNAVVLCSIETGTTMEGVPVSLMEAMAAGVPCVATRSGSVPELIGEGEGLLVPCGDVDGVAHALLELARNPQFAQDTGAHGRRRVAADYNLAINVDRLVSLMVAHTASSVPEPKRA